MKIISRLDLSNHNLIQIPDSVLQDKNLQELDLSNNRLTHIPPEICRLKNLVRLDLSSNRLEELPWDIFKLEKLTYLNISFNRVKELPASLFRIMGLESLWIEENQLEELSGDISLLSGLKTLVLNRNHLKRLPPEICRLAFLQQFACDRNPLQIPPVEIAVHGIEAIRNYFKDWERDASYLPEIKLLVVGDAGVGKTSLSKKIHDPSYMLKKDNEQDTEEININTWVIPKDEILLPINFRVNIWDFGRRESLHSTHRLFMSRRSLYLLVVESKKEYDLDGLYHWLDTIKALGGGSPVIIVCNKCDQRFPGLDISEYYKRFDNIYYLETSCLEGEEKTIEKLRTKIKEIVAEKTLIPHVRDKLPAAWLHIRRELEKLRRKGKDYVNYGDYLKICSKYGMDKEEATYLSERFNDLGFFLHFREDFPLENTIFINIRYVSEALNRIFEDEIVKKRHGRFSDEDLNRLWGSQEDYKSKRAELVSLLIKEKFKLCFKLKEGEYFVPHMQPKNKKNYPWRSSENNLQFEYRYDDSQFMPKGILTTFILKRYSDIYENTYWRHGVLLEYENTRAIVKESYKERKISITLEGPNKKGFLNIIRHTFHDIYEEIGNWSVAEMIPCNCFKCKSQADRDDIKFFDYETVRGFERAGREKIACTKSYQEVLVRTLIDDTVHENNDDSPLDRLRRDLIEKAVRMLGRKGTKKLEDLYNDEFRDFLHDNHYFPADQTRSGLSGDSQKNPGEIDIMIRNERGTPVSIIESFRLSSCGKNNTVVSSHVNKLIHYYDTAGHKRNFIIVFAEAKKFVELWKNYTLYMKNLNEKEGFSKRYRLLKFEDTGERYSDKANVRVGIALHEREERIVEVCHIFINMS
jgi:GTPase SAR1 family protein